MKKYVILLTLAIFLIGQFVGIADVNSVSQINNELNQEISYNDFTHAVFAEECTATWCPNCPYAAEALYNIYESGDYPFYYVALLNDVNPNAKERLRDYSFGIYKGYAFPTVYFDGGIENLVGRGNTVEQTESYYREVIEEVGQREVNQPIELNTTVEWLGNAEIQVDVLIKNNGDSFYFGKIRSYVAERESRWNDYEGNPYHFGFLDFAIDSILLLKPESSKTITVIWDGKEDHNGITFGDIVKENIIVFSAVSFWKPAFKIGYESDSFTQKYFAFAVDQSVSAIPK